MCFNNQITGHEYISQSINHKAGYVIGYVIFGIKVGGSIVATSGWF